MDITGIICPGVGGASRIPEALLRIRCQAAGVQLVRGTFNVKPRGLSLTDAVESLGQPDFETDQDNRKLGPLRWWRSHIESEGANPIDCFVVRHHVTGTGYLEVMATVRLRETLNVADGSIVTLRR